MTALPIRLWIVPSSDFLSDINCCRPKREGLFREALNPRKFVNIYEAGEEDSSKATHRIYHDAKWPSGISIPILKDQ